MKYINLTGKRGIGKQTIVDDDTFEKYGHMSWFLSDTGYALHTVSGQTAKLRLHRLVANTPPGLITDHKNHNRLDNRASNLRVVTTAQNNANVKVKKGYTWDASKNKWLVRYKQRHYGRYETETEAIAAYKLACSGIPYEPVRYRRKLFHLPTNVSKLKVSKFYHAKFVYQGEKYYLGTFAKVYDAEKAIKEMKDKVCQ